MFFFDLFLHVVFQTIYVVVKNYLNFSRPCLINKTTRIINTYLCNIPGQNTPMAWPITFCCLNKITPLLSRMYVDHTTVLQYICTVFS